MNKKQIIRKTKQLRVYSERKAKRNSKYTYKPFLTFANELETRIIKSNDINDNIDEIIKDYFIPQMKQQILFLWKMSLTDFINYFMDVWNRNIVTDKIQPIKNKIYNRELNKKVAKKVTKISETFRSILNTRISELAESGLGARDIAKEVIKLSKGEIGKKRALLIAREETSQVLARTNHTTAVSAKLETKTWIHAGGGKTDRVNHLALDGVTIPAKEYFQVGDYKALYPKHDILPAKELINCYCLCFYN